MADTNCPVLRELFVEELAAVQGGGPEDLVNGNPELGVCQHWYTTMACGEEGPPCPSDC